MPLGRQPAGHLAVHPLGSADGVGVQAVVDEAYPHGGVGRLGPEALLPFRAATQGADGVQSSTCPTSISSGAEGV